MRAPFINELSGLEYMVRTKNVGSLKSRMVAAQGTVSGAPSGLPPERFMSKKGTGYSVVPFLRMRPLIVDFGRIAQRKHTIRCLVEVDVTKARQLIREYRKKTGTAVSFTAFVIACVARAVAAERAVHA